MAKPKQPARRKVKRKAAKPKRAKPKRVAKPKRARARRPASRPATEPSRISGDDVSFAKGTFDGIPAGGVLWEIIDEVKQASGGELTRACSAFRQLLEELDDTNLIRAVSEFTEAMRRAYDYNLWGAAYLIHGGCGDDAFWDFRAGVIALGKKTFEAALRDPDSLASIDDLETRTLFEGFQYVPTKVLEERGLSLADPGHNAGKPTGENWTEEDLERRYPRLAARFN